MKEVRISATFTPRKPKTKVQRERVLNDSLDAIHAVLWQSMEQLLHVKILYNNRWPKEVVLENYLRAQLAEQKGSAEFQQLGRIFVIVDNLLNGPQVRQQRLVARREELKARKAKNAVKHRNKRTAKLRAA